jgi:ribosomal protein L22
MRKERDSLKLVVDNLRAQRYEPALQEEQWNVEREDCDSTAKERDNAVLKVQRIGAERTATMERDALKLEAQNLSVPDNVAALLEDQLNIAKTNATS